MNQVASRAISDIAKFPKAFWVILGAAVLWWLSQYFVTHKEYDKDQMETKSSLIEIKIDVKELLKKK